MDEILREQFVCRGVWARRDPSVLLSSSTTGRTNLSSTEGYIGFDARGCILNGETPTYSGVSLILDFSFSEPDIVPMMMTHLVRQVAFSWTKDKL